MRGKGICYDAGFLHAGVSSRERFDLDVVAREMRIIHDDLHCTAVRITGGDPERIEVAADLAADAGLEVWFSPFTSDLTEDEMLRLLVDCAERAERVRRRGAEVVLVTGGELSLMNRGFLPGDTLPERIGLLADPARLRELIGAIPARINDFLGRAVPAVRERFAGKVAYAAIPFERVDWTPFDFVGRRPVSLDRGRRSLPGRHPDARRAGQAGRDHRVRHGVVPRRRRSGRAGGRGRRLGRGDGSAGPPGRRLRARRSRAGHLPARAARDLRCRRGRQRLRVHLRAQRAGPPARWRPTR